MTKPLRAAVEIIVETLQLKGKILEIGSRQEKNQRKIANLRPFFHKSEYLGIDMRPGPGVDRVVDGGTLPFKDESFDVVICLETMEHASRPGEVAAEIERVLSRDGVALVSSQQNFPIHMHPSDYFRYTPFGLAILFSKLKQKLVVAISPPFDDEVKLNPQAVLLIGWKKRNKSIEDLKRNLIQSKSRISAHKPYRHRIQDAWKIMKRAFSELSFRQEIEFFEID